MKLLIAGLVAGVVGMIALFMLKGTVKLFTPNRHHLTIDVGFDRGLRFVGRWFGRAMVVAIIGLIAYVIWIATQAT